MLGKFLSALLKNDHIQVDNDDGRQVRHHVPSAGRHTVKVSGREYTTHVSQGDYDNQPTNVKLRDSR